MLRPIRGRVFGDVHFCHSQTPAEKIDEEIRHYFPYSKEFFSYDVLILEGDYWDKLMPNNHQDVFVTESNIYYLLNWCKHFDITLLIVDGTPLHDAGQMEKFEHININSGINADIVFVKDIDIRYIPKLDINVLFIPDRPRSSPDDTYNRVLDIMRERGLDKIDLAVMHGCFQYQLPEIASDHKHKEKNYLDIVKGPIFIGHVHTHSSFERIIAPGSFSRLKHGEEEAKGFVDFVLNIDGSYKAKFVENKLATIYKTIDVSDLTIEDTLEKIKKEIETLPSGSKVRIKCQQGHPLTSDKTFMSLKVEYIGFAWSIKITTDKSIVATAEEVFSTENEYIPLIINENNIVDLILNKLSSKNYSNEILKSVPKYLESI